MILCDFMSSWCENDNTGVVNLESSMADHRILLIDDDTNLCTVVSHQLEGMGYAVTVRNSGGEGIEAFKAGPYDLILLDLQMPDMHGLEVLGQIRRIDADVVIVIITAYGTVEGAVDACQKGADDYLTKPFAKEQLCFAIEKALRLRTLEKDNVRLKRELEEKFRFGNIITRNKKMSQLLAVAERAAHSDASVLIYGESGTGKEMMAKAIHHHSTRKDRPFVAINCPSIPESLLESELFGHEKGAFTGAIASRPGKFELAEGGTIFLDEIGDLKIDLQAKLLRVLKEREIEGVGGAKPIAVYVRVIAATNQDLLQLVEAGRFRTDLYYRLNVIPLNIPPLRERLDDLPELIKHFIRKYSPEKMEVPAQFLRQLLAHNWPGKVRELENLIQRAVVLSAGKTLVTDGLDINQTSQLSQATSLAEIEKRAIVQALERHNYNQTQTARELEIPRHVLLYRMKKLGISADAQ